MDTKQAEEILNDYLMNGLVTEIFWADEARAAAVSIGERSPDINAAGFGDVLGHLQTIFSERETMAVAKLYDPPDKRYPTRSIPAMLDLIERHADLWNLPQRHALEKCLASGGQAPAVIQGMSNEALARAVVSHYRLTLPEKGKASTDKLSAGLEAVREARNKVHAHNEAIDKAARTRATWGDTRALLDYAKEFACVIGYGFLGIYSGHSAGDYRLSNNARRFSWKLNKLLDKAGIGGVSEQPPAS